MQHEQTAENRLAWHAGSLFQTTVASEPVPQTGCVHWRSGRRLSASTKKSAAAYCGCCNCPRFLPSADLTDQEAEEAQGGPESEEILFVFQRVAEEAAEEEEEQEPEEERPATPVLNLFGGTRRVESLATQVERQVESQRTRKGTQVGTLGNGHWPGCGTNRATGPAAGCRAPLQQVSIGSAA
eukprot:GHUV01045908.1.p1 GENE.GHUV01045908.1~~GHUV01045908.1.p1  ORF type:complete len:183 (-),score=52.45 GHUV01045908.1:61-609(-)